jgi:hypothetical protein
LDCLFDFHVSCKPFGEKGQKEKQPNPKKGLPKWNTEQKHWVNSNGNQRYPDNAQFCRNRHLKMAL